MISGRSKGTFTPYSKYASLFRNSPRNVTMLRFAAIPRRLSCPKHSVSTSALPTALWPSPTPTTPWSSRDLAPARPFVRSYILSKTRPRRAASCAWSPGRTRSKAYLNARMPGRLIQSTKSYLASRLFSRTQIFNQTFSLEELIGTLLRYLRKSAEAQFGDLGGKLVVGRPVHFSGTKDPKDDDFAVARLRKAFANAGFDEVHFLPEPVAAAYKYRQQLDHDELVLIADFGGGTSDFSLVKLQPAQASTSRIGRSSDRQRWRRHRRRYF